MTGMVLAPEPILPEHDLSSFDCGEPTLYDWLKRRALVNQATGATRTFVLADQGRRVLGYYAIAAGALSHREATGAVKRNMPEPIPVMVLGRLAIDRSVQGKDYGGALLKDAVQRCFLVAQNTGVRALLVHALNDSARKFYEYYGFQTSPTHPMTLMLRLNTPKL
jgi:GNAT superfamily N-acetyltransferase